MERWKIWITCYNDDKRITGYAVYPQDYASKQSAMRRARQLMNESDNVICVASQERPWTFPEKV